MVINESTPAILTRCQAGIVSLLFIFLLVNESKAQLQVRSLPHDNQIAQRAHRSGRTKELPPLTLPFFDDFSKPYVNPLLKETYPDTNRWENSYTVWVNDGLGINAPTINVASFDGLDSIGNPYNATEIFLNGFTDSLISRAIDLSETAAANPVSLAERNSVFLSFYYQWKGNGEAPDADDYLEVQFRNDQGKWETVLTIKTPSAPDKEKFDQAIVKVDGDRFYTKRFQFRFRTFGRQSGPFDTWNLDYVYLNKSRSANDITLGAPDQAISSPLSTIFPNKYRAVPYYHFLSDPSLIQPKFQVFNLKGNPPEVLTYFVKGDFTSFYYSASDTTSSTVQLNNLNPAGTPISINDRQGEILPFSTELVTVNHINSIDTITALDPDADAAIIKLKANLITGDNVEPDGTPAEDYDPKYIPIDFRINDTITTKYELANYYAYDDGVAEYAGGLISAGNVFAYRFDLNSRLHDTLKIIEAFDIYFPSFGLPTPQNAEFFIFDEVDGKPNEIKVRISSVPITPRGTNTFQRIRFFPKLQLTRNSFFIGWRQPVAGQLLVGLDISNDTGDRMFFNTEGSINPEPSRWETNTLIKGSFMVRPVFGTGVVDPFSGIEDKASVAIFPNPNRGAFQIAGTPENITVLSIAGQPVTFEKETSKDKTFIKMNVPPGLYIVRYRASSVVHTQKVVVTE